MSVKQLLVTLAACALTLPVWAGVKIQHWTTPQGAQVYFVENHDIPMLDVAVDFPAGSRFDSADRTGLASLTFTMLDQGAGGMTDIAIAQRLADVGAELGGAFDRDRAGVSMRTLSSAREREAALSVLVTVLQKPEFPQSVMQRERARMIAALREEESRPGEVADKAFYRALYGNHGYGLPESGTAVSLMKLKRSDLQAWYQAHYRAGDAVISMIGDLSRAEAEQLAMRISTGLPQGKMPDMASQGKAAEAEKTMAAPLPSEKRIPHPSTQSHVLMGQIGIARKDTDYFPLYVGNHVLGGGGFDSRMVEEVRQKRGYAYSAYSYFFPMELPGPLVIGLQTKNSQAGEALKVARETVAKFVAEGPTEAELKQAKNNLVGGFPLRIDSNKKILDYLRAIGFYQLPLNYLDTWVDNVEAVTLEQIRDAFKRRVNPDKLTVVVVGGDAK
jgi:zinc protease